MYPELFRFTLPFIGEVTIHSFGVMFMLSFLIPILMMQKEFSRRSIPPQLASNIGIAAIIGGVIGARIYFIIEHWQAFVANPLAMIFSGAGLVWYGGFAGGLLAVLWVVHRSKVAVLEVADVVMPLLLFGNGIGRIGCLLAADGDYGPPSDVPWAMAFPEGYVPTDVPVHPTPLYDTLLAFLFFAIIWSRRKSDLAPGLLMSWALIAMGAERFITEFYRTTPRIAFGWMTLAQFISLGLIVIGLIFRMRSVQIRQRSPGTTGDVADSEKQ